LIKQGVCICPLFRLKETKCKATQFVVDRESLHFALYVSILVYFEANWSVLRRQGYIPMGMSKLLWIYRFCDSGESVTEKWEHIVKLNRNQQPSQVYGGMDMHEHSQVHE